MPEVFRAPETMLTGRDAFREIGRHAARYGTRCLVVTGRKAMREQGHLDRALSALREAGVGGAVFEGVENDPSCGTVDRIRETLRQGACDVVLGLGGGSAIDAAKAAAALHLATDPTRAAFDGGDLPRAGLPVLAAPSTFGTGTEATWVSVLSDPGTRRKKGVRHPNMLPRVAVVDPMLGMGMPPRVTAASGMDALTQAIESYLSRHATDLTQALSYHAAALLVTGLPRAYDNGADLEAREMTANGSLMAGLALNNARLGLVHGLAHPLGIRYGLAHGEVCAVLLPHVLAFNRDAAPERYALLSGILGGDAAEAVAALLRRMNLPADLRQVPIPPADHDAIAAETLPSGSTKANPRPVERDDVRALLERLTA
jgi:alcohol dehydrogenase class IV